MVKTLAMVETVPTPTDARTLSAIIADLGAGGEVVHQKRERVVYRLTRGDTVLFAKRGRGRKRREIVAEADVHAALARAGVPVAPLIASGEVDGAAWIVTRAATGRPLSVALAETSDTRRLLAVVAALVRSLHGAGFACPDLTATHVFVAADAASLIDVARAVRPRGGVSDTDRARDIAALHFSLPYGTTSRLDRTRLVRDASGLRGRALGAFAVLLERELDRLRLRTRWRHGHAGARDGVLAAAGRPAGSNVFEGLMDASGMHVLRTLDDRENRCFGESAAGRPAYYMKAYPPVSRGHSPAMRERLAIDLFTRKGVPVCRHRAYGEDVERGSFLVVETCRGEPLDDLLRRGVAPADRRAIAAELGRLYGRMRRSGLRHRDAYACHVFAALAPLELRLIDMTRAGVAPIPQGRWFVKDVAQLWHGIPAGTISRVDALRFLRAYFGVRRLGAAERRFVRRVIAKERRMAARAARHARRASA